MSAGTFQFQTARKPQTRRTSQPRYLGREADSDVPVVRGFCRVLSLPQTGCLQESEIFLPILQLRKRRHQQSDAPGYASPHSIAPRAGRKSAIARNTQGMLQRSQIRNFSKSAPKSELGSI